MFDLSDPMPQNPDFSVPVRNAWVSAETSIGSPTGVPVPWVSTYVTVSGLTPAMESASTIEAACPSTLGAR